MKTLIKKIFALLGLTVTRTRKGGQEKGRFAVSEAVKFKWVQDMNIKTIIDIGSNIGDSALLFHKFRAHDIIHEGRYL